MPIEATDRRVGAILNGQDFFFSIPEYQRLYRWGKAECSDLVNDLWNHLDDYPNAEIADIPEYFLGNIVLVRANGNNGNNRYDIIDGQQRLTTLTILFSVLHFLEDDDEMRAALANRLRTAGDAANGIAPQALLTVREAMREVFEIIQDPQDGHRTDFFNAEDTLHDILQRGPTEVEETVRANACHMLDLFRSRLPEANAQQQRHRFIRFLNQRCTLVVAITDNVDAAMRVFTVMNSRGLDLAPTDILKPEILGAGEAQGQELARRWEEIEEGLGRDDFQNLFSHIRFIYGRDEIRGSLVQRFRTQVLEGLDADNPARHFMGQILEPYAHAFELASEPRRAFDHISGTGGHDQALGIRQILENLNELESDSWKPVVMFAFRLREQNPAPGWNRFLEMLRRIEAIAFSLALRRASKSERAQRFGGLIEAIEAAWENPDHALPGAFALTDGEQQETLAALDGPIYRRRNMAKAVLLLLDRDMAEGGANYDHRTISVEHVLPQTLPEGGWNGGDDEIWGGNAAPTEQDHAEWLHRLANLVLLSRRRNAQAGNWPYARKKENYFFANGPATPFVLTNGLQVVEAWTPNVLQERQNRLMGMLQNRWGLA